MTRRTHHPSAGPIGVRGIPRLASLLAVLFVLTSGGAGLAQTDRAAVARLHELVLPEFKLKDATLREGLETVRDAWARRYPEFSFPIVLMEKADGQPGEPSRAALDLKNVSALTAVRSLARGTGMTVQHALDVLVLRPSDVLWPKWPGVDILNISDRMMEALGLSGITYDPGPQNDVVNEALGKRLAGLGVRFKPPFKVNWCGNNQLTIASTQEEADLVKGLLLLLDAGCTMQKRDR